MSWTHRGSSGLSQDEAMGFLLGSPATTAKQTIVATPPIGLQYPELPSQGIRRSILLHFTPEPFPEFLPHLTYATFPKLSSWLALFLLGNECTSFPTFQRPFFFAAGSCGDDRIEQVVEAKLPEYFCQLFFFKSYAALDCVSTGSI